MSNHRYFRPRLECLEGRDLPATHLLPLINPGFEYGNLNGWTILSTSPTTPAVVAGMTGTPEGTFQLWGAGTSNSRRVPRSGAAVAQRIDLTNHAAGIDGGDAALIYRGWGRGNGSGAWAALELRFFDANGDQLGDLLFSGRARSRSSWRELSIDAVVPVGARTVEMAGRVRRPLTDPRPSRAGLDDLSVELTYDDPLPPPPAPIITIAATDASAAETGPDPAVFTLTRTGNSAQGLTVSYTLGGGATNGGDYTALTGSATFLANSATTTIVVTPQDDPDPEPVETVVVSLQDGADYDLGAAATATAAISDNDVLPVLMVLANTHFYYREYAEPRAELEAAGIQVVVAAATRTLCTPHNNSGQGADGGFVMPNLALADVNPANYSAIVFVGGWGASAYQYAFTGQYAMPVYNGTAAAKQVINDLINAFIAQDKFVTAICHGVTVLAYARVNGVSPVAGHWVSTHNDAPAANIGDGTIRWHIEQNGAMMFPLASLGDPRTAADDVWVDGKIITAQNYDAAQAFGRVLAQELRAD